MSAGVRRGTVQRRAGAFEAPAEPPHRATLEINPSWSAARLSWALIRGVWPWAISGAALLIVFNTAAMLLPAAIGSLVDEAVLPAADGSTLPEVWHPLALWSGALIALYACMNLGYRFGGRLGWYGVQRSQFMLSQAVISRVLDARGMAGPTSAPGRLLAIATGDVHRACLVLYVTVYPPGEIIGLVVATSLLLSIHTGLGIGVIIALPVVLGLMHLAAKPLQLRSMREQAGLADAAAAAADLVAGYRVIRGLHAQRAAADRYRNVSRTALRGTLAARSAEALFAGLSTLAAQLFAAAVALVAAVLAFAGQLTVGQLITVAGIAVTLVGPLESLVGALGAFWAVSQASARRVLDLVGTAHNPASLGTHALSPPVASPPAPTPALEFDAVALAGGSALDGHVNPGEFVVIRLPHAAHGMFAELLSAKALPTHGTVLLGGLPVHEYQAGALREHLLVLPHTPGLFSGTVLDNTRSTGGAPVPDEVVRQALQVAGIPATELPDGYDTAVGDGGWELSGGQRQRIALARSIAADPAMLVLIEPTSSVDAVTEHGIATRLRAHRAGRTTIVVTDSPSFRAVADRSLAAVSTEGSEDD